MPLVFSGWLDIAYLLLLAAVSPVLLVRMLRQGKYRDGWAEKFLGRLPVRSSAKPCIWFHAVSVGEVLQLETVLRASSQKLSGVEFVVTTTTKTGWDVARDKFPGHLVCYFPLDFSWAVRRAIRRIHPTAIVLVELELWPNFILEAERTGTPLALINGRISERSFRGYRKIRPLMKRLLNCFDTIAVQNQTYADRLRKLGAPPNRIRVTGSIKFDGVATNRRNEKTTELRKSFGMRDGDRVFIAGSTQAPEEEYALQTWLTLRKDFPDLRLILVPRHKERFEEVARLIEMRGLPLLRRSQQAASGAASATRFQPSSSGPAAWKKTAGLHRPLAVERPVLLLDTLGELAACWGLADVAFVGGSLTNRGGQNMIEPAAFGAAVLFGPNTHNFRDVVDLLLRQGAARVVGDADDLTSAVRWLLEHPADAAKQGQIAQQLVLAQQGATARTIDVISRLISKEAETSDAIPARAA